MVTEGRRQLLTVALGRRRQRDIEPPLFAPSPTRSDRADARVSIPSAHGSSVFPRPSNNVGTKKTRIHLCARERLRRRGERRSSDRERENIRENEGEGKKKFGFPKRIATPPTGGMRRYPHKTSKLKRERLKLFRRPRRRAEREKALVLPPDSTIQSRMIRVRILGRTRVFPPAVTDPSIVFRRQQITFRRCVVRPLILSARVYSRSCSFRSISS